MSVTTSTNTPRVWIGCLACYNEGNLLGEWIEGADADEMTTQELHNNAGREAVDEFGQPHEELWIFDHENYWGALDGECDPMHAAEVARALESVEEEKMPALAAFAENYRYKMANVGDWIDEFEEAYVGEFDSWDDYAGELIDECYNIPEELAAYIDYQKLSRDLKMDYFTADADGGGEYVFRSI